MSTRKEILEMLSTGSITVDQATQLLGAAGDESNAVTVPDAPQPTPASAPHVGNSKKGRWLRIQVSDLESGKHRVRVNVPLGLVNFGLKIGARFTDEMDQEMMQGVMDALQEESIVGTLVEVEDVEDNERVHIFVE